MIYEHTIVVREDHPSLAGHFPDHPIVPGVVILGELMAAVRLALGNDIIVVALPHAKFLVPLVPNAPVAIRLETEVEGSLSFSCRAADSSLIAQGALEYRRRAT
ncbi:MAG: hypothetical protein ACT4OO_01215 [Nitrospiraceae bacterium]